MKIFIDIGHPAHVHYFRNFIKIMRENGHDFFVTARDKEVTQVLLDHYQIPYRCRGKGRNRLSGKLLYMARADFLLWYFARGWKPDVFVSFASPYAAHVAGMLHKPHIVLDDTESAGLNHRLYKPFSKSILTPAFFSKSMGPNHIRFNSLMELSYLHPVFFQPDPAVLEKNGIDTGGKKLALLRLVSWGANHDVGQAGIAARDLDGVFELLKDDYHVLVSAEGRLPEKYLPFKIKLPPHEIHDLLGVTDLFITEGATMASEAALLGTPVIYVNSLNAGTISMLESEGLIVNLRDSGTLTAKVKDLLQQDTLKANMMEKKNRLLEKLINPTRFLVWFVENYPESRQIMLDDPGYQEAFR